MKRMFAIILAVALSLALANTLHGESQTWAVCYFRELPTDMDAKVNYPKRDADGHLCAIIKIETPYTGFTFDTGTLAVVSSVQKVGEIWVYVPQGVRKITIGHTKGILREWTIPTTIRSGSVYVLKLEEDSVHRAEIAAQQAAASTAAASKAAAAQSTAATSASTTSTPSAQNPSAQPTSGAPTRILPEGTTAPTPLPQRTRKTETETLYITASILGAVIYVDGKSIGRYTGKPLKVRVECGTHSIGATYKEHSGYTQRVAVYESGSVHIKFNTNLAKTLQTSIPTYGIMEFCFYTAGTALIIPGILIAALDEPGVGITFTAIGTALMTPGIVATVKKNRLKQSIYNLKNQNSLYTFEAAPVIYSTPDLAAGTVRKGFGVGVKLTF